VNVITCCCHSDFSAFCYKPEPYLLEKLVHTLRKKAKSSGTQRGHFQNQQLAVSLRGVMWLNVYEGNPDVMP